MAGKKLMSVALCAAMVGTMVGAVAVHAESDYAGLKIEIVSKGFQHQYWQAVLKGAEEKAEELGCSINFVGPNSESDLLLLIQAHAWMQSDRLRMQVSRSSVLTLVFRMLQKAQ